MNNLYTTHAEEFSKTRQSPWTGWINSLEYIHNIGKSISILDIGCGNGRFLEFLKDNNFDSIKYLGIDNSNILLNIAKNKFKDIKNIEFLNIDILNNDWNNQILDKFKLIVGFGITHHLETENSRNEFFKNIDNLSEDNTIIVLTFWQFTKLKTLMNNSILISENLYELSFGKNNAKRICYDWNFEEIDNNISKYNWKIVAKYHSDGRNNELNMYYILKKNI